MGTSHACRSPIANCWQRRPWKVVRDRLAAADRLMYAEIADRRKDPKLSDRIDALSMLVREADEDGRAMTDTELRDQLMTLLFAGHDTTATALSWALERLTRHPALLTRPAEAATRAPRVTGRRRLSGRGGQGEPARAAGRLRRRPGAHRRPRRYRRLPATGRRHGGAGDRAGARRRGRVSGPRPFRPGSDGRHDTSARPRGCRSAAVAVGASAPRSRRRRCGSCCARCCRRVNLATTTAAGRDASASST